MTLNEAIERAKEKAAELRERNCIECAVEHEQLATGLEELSKFQWIPVTGNVSSSPTSPNKSAQ